MPACFDHIGSHDFRSPREIVPGTTAAFVAAQRRKMGRASCPCMDLHDRESRRTDHSNLSGAPGLLRDPLHNIVYVFLVKPRLCSVSFRISNTARIHNHVRKSSGHGVIEIAGFQRAIPKRSLEVFLGMLCHPCKPVEILLRSNSAILHLIVAFLRPNIDPFL